MWHATYNFFGGGSDKTNYAPGYLSALHHALNEEWYLLHVTVFVEMLELLHMSRISPPFMDSEHSLPCSLELASTSSSSSYLGQYLTARTNLYTE
jgi:hypothetical protein